MPPSSDHSRTFTGLPSTGKTFIVADKLVPCDCAYRLLLPTPVVPTDNQYSVTPAPALHANVTDGEVSVEPGVGLLSELLTCRSAVLTRTSMSRKPPGLSLSTPVTIVFPWFIVASTLVTVPSARL